ANRDQLSIYLEDGQILQVQSALVCCGHRGNLSQEQVAKAGLNLDDQNRLWCNEDYQTWTPGIFALGQIVGYPDLAFNRQQQDEQMELLMKSLTEISSFPAPHLTISQLSFSTR